MKLIIKQHNQTIFHQRLLMILILAIITLAKAQAQTDSSYIEPALEATDSLRRQMGISDKAVEKQLDKIKKMPLLLNDTVATQKKQKRLGYMVARPAKGSMDGFGYSWRRTDI